MRRGEMRAMLLDAARVHGVGALLTVRPKGIPPSELMDFVRGAVTGWAEYLRIESSDVHGNVIVKVIRIPPSIQ